MCIAAVDRCDGVCVPGASVEITSVTVVPTSKVTVPVAPIGTVAVSVTGLPSSDGPAGGVKTTTCYQQDPEGEAVVRRKQRALRHHDRIGAHRRCRRRYGRYA